MLSGLTHFCLKIPLKTQHVGVLGSTEKADINSTAAGISLSCVWTHAWSHRFNFTWKVCMFLHTHAVFLTSTLNYKDEVLTYFHISSVIWHFGTSIELRLIGALVPDRFTMLHCIWVFALKASGESPRNVLNNIVQRHLHPGIVIVFHIWQLDSRNGNVSVILYGSTYFYVYAN